MEDYMIYYFWRGKEFAKDIIEGIDWYGYYKLINGKEAKELKELTYQMDYNELTEKLCECFDLGQIFDITEHELLQHIEWDRRMLTRANPATPFRSDDNNQISEADFKKLKLSQMREEIESWWH